MSIDTVHFFEQLRLVMNAHPERYSVLGDADMVAVIEMDLQGGARFAVRLEFEGLSCTDVSEIDPLVGHLADFRLVGPLEAWQAMFDDIHENGTATGRQTINSLALLGDAIVLRGDDPMGLDKFSRFNQTLQEFLDGAAAVPDSALVD